jgi:hypothetical protein
VVTVWQYVRRASRPLLFYFTPARRIPLGDPALASPRIRGESFSLQFHCTEVPKRSFIQAGDIV